MAIDFNELYTSVQQVINQVKFRLLARRGNKATLDLTKLMSGEFAVCEDTEEVFVSFGNGKYKNLTSGTVILGVYATLGALQAAHPTGNAGDIYAVGSAPQHLYVWQGGAWADMGAWNDITSYATTAQLASVEEREIYDKKKMENLPINSDFRTGTDGWTTQLATQSASNNELTITPTAKYGQSDQSITLISGHKYYFALYMKTDSSLVSSRIHDGSSYFITLTSAGNGVATHYSGIGTAAGTAGTIALGIDSRDSGWTASKFYYVVLIDLTARFGAGNEPSTAAKMDAWLATYPNYYLDKYINTGIVGTGSNANGSYVKYADGTMVCRHEKITSLTTDIPLASPIYAKTDTWTYPIAFYDGDVIVISNIVRNTGLYGWATAPICGISSASIMVFSYANNIVDGWQAVAFGRWKA